MQKPSPAGIPEVSTTVTYSASDTKKYHTLLLWCLIPGMPVGLAFAGCDYARRVQNCELYTSSRRDVVFNRRLSQLPYQSTGSRQLPCPCTERNTGRRDVVSNSAVKPAAVPVNWPKTVTVPY
jgi:hypothetical protein